ncbi:MAG: hypothetical protein HXY34_07535 [Candidatus Thorarchaeota archaeon]|nr:hypothetical protein [Candidatus Thorarchaeota archaeon]
MTKPEEFGGHKMGNPTCVYCSNEDGSLKPRSIVREEMISYWMDREKIPRSDAEKAVDNYMATMPAWKGKK